MADDPNSPVAGSSLGVQARFFAGLGHEIRTPLNGILGMATLLGKSPLGAAERNYVETIQQSGEKLLHLLNTVIDFARLDAEAIELENSYFSPGDLLSSVTELLAHQAYQKDIEIGAIDLQLNGYLVQGDEGRIRQILFNLAGNALKFTAAGGVLLRADFRETPNEERAAPPVKLADARTGVLRFTAEDSGPGIPRDKRDMIFDDFVQVSPAHAHLGGAGLGLAISKRLARAMRALIGVDDNSWGGASFWVEIPAFAQKTEALDGKFLQHLRVGLWGDNCALQEYCRDLLRSAGMRAPLQLLTRHSELRDLDVILLDDRALDGQIPRFMRDASVPLLVLLAPERRDRLADYMVQGASGYLIKPLRAKSVLERLRAVGRSDMRMDEDDRLQDMGKGNWRVLLAEDNPVNALLARKMLAQSGFLVDVAANGQEAVNMVAQSNYDLVLMDLRMPVLGGIEATRQIRAISGPQGRVAIVALTAEEGERERKACREAGMNDFARKPLNGDELQTIFARLLPISRAVFHPAGEKAGS